MALLLATAVSCVYAHRAWQAYLARLTMRPSVPSTVQQQTAALALSKVTGNRTEYTVRASHALMEFTGRRAEPSAGRLGYGLRTGRAAVR